ncbi:hypothetical protein AB1K54_01415 [Microbacterium sp. BWT-B31]|uniref:hypothetical protein n=1 Tax=Microbacterium sp. BWT-B31 TaxID=3232072 RepID=UPI003528407A
MADDRIWRTRASRRAFLGLLTAAPVAALAACAADRPPLPHAVPATAAPTPGTATTGVPTAASARPVVVPSFGPNGTHWPEHTPWLGEAVAHIIEVGCTWPAIATALARVTPAQAAAGVHLKVLPGTLTGTGSSSGSKAVLQGLGSADWAKNVLVSPRDGRGTVTISGPARLRDVKGITFARIDADDLLLTNCTRTAWAHAKMSKGLRMASSYNSTTRECGAYEIVMADAKADISDPLGYAAGEGCTLTDCVWDGCYGAPVFRPNGATDHVDTLQMYGSGWYRGLTVRDTTFFGSLNCALQIGGSRPDDPGLGTAFLTLEHSIITSQATAIRVRYPVPDGAQTPSMDQALNGIGEPGQLHAKDSYIFGSMYKSQWGRVQNTHVSYVRALDNNPVADGEWTYDSSLASWGAADFDRLTPTPTPEFLASIWT